MSISHSSLPTYGRWCSWLVSSFRHHSLTARTPQFDAFISGINSVVSSIAWPFLLPFFLYTFTFFFLLWYPWLPCLSFSFPSSEDPFPTILSPTLRFSVLRHGHLFLICPIPQPYLYPHPHDFPLIAVDSASPDLPGSSTPSFLCLPP